jgi:16S rRNA (guanine(527)-N(7))-methyltransferase RsmG
LTAEFGPYGQLTEGQVSVLEKHYELLTRWNQRMNLTRIEKLEDVVRLHYCESLFLGTLLPSGSLRIADVGSGAGFPGFPIAILRPECRVDLIESNRRKAVFLREACAGVPNIQVSAKRAEDVAERYDWVVSRAVVPRDVIASGLAQDNGLLMASVDIESLRQTPKMAADVPWGQGRIAALFHVERLPKANARVPRGT